MAKRLVYVVRGVCIFQRDHGPETVRYKIVRGQVRRMTECRGEDHHDSHFHAIFYGAEAFRQWRYSPIGLKFDFQAIEVDG